MSILPWRCQELYTSPSGGTIVDALGHDALVSLVGTIASGLTWSGGVFVNPMIARVENLKIITLTGVLIMSLGLILASFSTRASSENFSLLVVLTFQVSAVAPLSHTGTSIWHRLVNVLLPHHDHNSYVFR
jgi:hypothetical protein